jgi:hypothetical protein
MILSKRNPAAGHSGGARKLVYFINANTANISLSRCDIQVFRASPKNCASSTRTAGSNEIVRLNRFFWPRIEVEHQQAVPTEDWFFTLHHVGEQGRHFVGMYRDVAVAFDVARAFQAMGVRVVCVDRVRP